MKQISEHLFRRGKRGLLQLRVRTPSRVLRANPDFRRETVKSMETSDVHDAVKRARRILTELEVEYDAAISSPPTIFARDKPLAIHHLDEAGIAEVAKFYTSSVLWSDQETRSGGMDDEEFDALSEKLEEQRRTFGRMLAQGKTLQLLPAFQQLMLFRGVRYVPTGDEGQAASYQFAKAVVQTLDFQLERQRGNVVDIQSGTPAPRDPFEVAFPAGQPTQVEGPSWDEVFTAWRDMTVNRPKSTTVASQTPWRQLRTFMEKCGKLSPADVTPVDMTAFVDWMVADGKAVKTINARLAKVRQIFKIAAGRHLLESNPATNTLGRNESGASKRKHRRLPFDERDLEILFGSDVFTRHLRSQGQSGEATYWIPLMMFYSGARPEEIAGLALSDIIDTPHGWYFNIADRPEPDEDCQLFDSSDV